ncbi:MAG: SPOR domain-containing protein [Ignavibacteriales bacterium]|nr:SPOR domain-containing protein [Ignavibacteriales bacterium]
MRSFPPNNIIPVGLVLIAGPLWLASCVSSEETGSGGDKAVQPQRTVTRIDTAQIQKQAETKAAEELKKSSRASARFTAKQDTVTASLMRKPKITPRPIVRPENPAYTVQIGAFGRAQNALRLQKIARERFASYVVLNNYAAVDKLYRVSVGKFDTRKEAAQLQREIMEKFPKDYSACWVNYIAK